jgi:hypothetical protein
VHNIDFDTGSADLWITNTVEATGETNTGQSWFVDYGSGSVSGTIYNMTVQIGETDYKGEVEVGVATTDHIQSLGLSGVVGLAFPDLADFSTPLLIQLNVSMFTLVLTIDGPGSALGLNCNDPGEGFEWQYITVAPAPSGMFYYWATHLSYLVVDGDNLFPIGSSKPVIFDSGTSGLAFPEATIMGLVTKLAASSGTNAHCDGSGETLDCYCTDCTDDMFPTMSLGFTSSNGHPVTVLLKPITYISCYPNYYYYGTMDRADVNATTVPSDGIVDLSGDGDGDGDGDASGDGSGFGQVCEIMVQPNNDQYLILGDAFLQRQKTYWNIDEKVFGLACKTGDGSCTAPAPQTTSFYDAGFGELLDEIPEKRGLMSAKQRKWERNMQQKVSQPPVKSAKLRAARSATKAALAAADATTAIMVSLPSKHLSSVLSTPLIMVCAASLMVLQVLLVIQRRRTYGPVE